MNNEKETMVLIDDFNNNKEYFDLVNNIKNLENKYNNAFIKYIGVLQKIFSTLTLKNIIDIDPSELGPSKYNADYRIVLSSKGLMERYTSNTYKSNSSEMTYEKYVSVVDEAVKTLLAREDLTDYQKNKIKPLSKFKLKIDTTTNETRRIKGVSLLSETLEILEGDIKIPHFILDGNYHRLSNISLLSIKEQIISDITEYYNRHIANIKTIDSIRMKVEEEYPILFLFGGK